MNKFTIDNVIIEKSDKDIKTGVKYNFEEGINIVCGKNEAGKSSLMKFLKGAFFCPNKIDNGKIFFSIWEKGLKKSYRADIKNDRKKDKRCILYNSDNETENYSLITNNINQKYFEQGFTINLDDLISLEYDNSKTLINVIKDPSGDKLGSYTKEYETQISKYMGANKKPKNTITEITDKINSLNIKISELSKKESDYNSYIMQIRKLDDEIQILEQKEKSSVIFTNLQQYNQSLLKYNDDLQKLISEFNEKLYQNKEIYLKIIQNTGKFESNIENIIKNKQKLEAVNVHLASDINRLNNDFNTRLDEEQIINFNINYENVNKINMLTENINEAKNDIKNYEKDIEDLEFTILNLKKESEIPDTKDNKILNPIIYLLLFIFLSFIGIYLFTQNMYPAAISSSVASILFFIIFIVLKLENNHKIIKQKIEQNSNNILLNQEKILILKDKIKEIHNKIEQNSVEINNIIKEDNENVYLPIKNYIQIIELIKSIKTKLIEKRNIVDEINELELKNEKIIKDFNDFIIQNEINISLNTDLKENTDKLIKLNEENNKLKTQISSLNTLIENVKNKIAELEKEKIHTEYKINIETETPEELVQMKKIKQNEKTELLKQYNFKDFESISSLKNEKNILINSLRKILKSLILNKAKQIVTEKAKNNFDKTQPDLINAQKYLSIITGGKYTLINASAEEITNKDGTIIKKWNELSRGTKEQLYLALRLGYASNYSKDKSTLMPNGKPDLPVIIDDAFVNFDFERIANVFNCLNEISKTNQIIYFTCHGDFIMNRLNQDVNVINID